MYAVERGFLAMPQRLQAVCAGSLSKILPGGLGKGMALWADTVRGPGVPPVLTFLRRLVRRVRPNPFGTFLWNVVVLWLVRGRNTRRKWLRRNVSYPALIQLSLTTRCNYRCKGCYADGWTKNEELDYAVVKRLLDEGREYGCTYYTLLGGEPFIYPDIVRMFYDYPDFYFQVYTNGSLISLETARHMERAGNVQAMISLEGFEEETDWRRGKGAYRNAMRAMSNLRRYGVPFGVGITVTPKNIDTVCSDAFVRELIDQGVLYMWYFWFQPYGDYSRTDLILSGDQRYRLWRRVNEIREQYPVLSADMFNDYAVVGCLASSGVSLNITPSGWVEPCAQVHFSSENIKDAPLRRILQTSPFLQGIFDFHRRGDRRCLAQECGRELADLVERCDARDDTGGRDTKALLSVAEVMDKQNFYSREEMDDFPDPYYPLRQFFFDCVKPSDGAEA